MQLENCILILLKQVSCFIFFVEHDPSSQYDPIFVTKAQMIDKGHVFLVIPPNTFYFDVSDVKNEVFIREFKVFYIQSTEENW